MSDHIDTIYYNGTVITMNDKQKYAEAVAVSGDTVAAAGSYSDMKALADDKTEYIDLQGKTMLPGFIDPHSHVLDTALRALWVNVNSYPFGSVLSR